MAGDNRTQNPGPKAGRGKPAAKARSGKTKPEEDVANTSAAYQRMLPKWHLMDTVLAGTPAMREAKEAYLPQHEYETNKNYTTRLNRTVFLNKTRDTLGSLVGKAFKVPPVLTEDAEKHLEEFVKDVDGSGSSMPVFARQWFKAGISKAFCHALVDTARTDNPVGEDGEERVRTKADDNKEGIRPFWSIIAPENLIFATSDMIDGREVYTHVRIKETVTERVGFAEVTIERIRVLEPGHYWLYELVDDKKNKEKWEIIEEGPWGPGNITLVTFYTDKEGACEGNSPLQDLAHLNVAHWQSSSDQRNVLTVARFPMLALEGADATDDDTGEPLVIGPNKWLSTPTGATIKYVEHSGAAIEAGRNDLHDLEEQMSQYASEFLKKQPGAGAPTATGRALDSAEAISPLQAMGTDFKAAMELLLEYTCAWMTKTEAECGVVFDIEVEEAPGSGNDTDVIDKARARRDISREGFLSELKRRDILDEDFDIDDDGEKLKEEADTALSMFGKDNMLPGEEDDDITDEDPEDDEGGNKGKKKKKPKAPKPVTPPVEE